jgi:predicted MFS family arabinose efflux permease
MIEASQKSDATNLARRGYVLLVLTVLSAFNFLDQQVMSILLEPVRQEFRLTDIELGLLSGIAFAALYTVLAVPAGIWAINHSRRDLIALAAAVWGAMTIACGLAQSFAQLILARLGVGIGEAGGLPPSQAWVSDLYKPGERATALATLAAGVNVGIFLAFLVGGYVGHTYGWRIAFAVAGVPPLLLAVLLRVTTRDVMPAKESMRATASLATVRTTLHLIWSDRILRQVLIAAILAMTVGYGAIAWIPSFLVCSRGFNIAQAGLYLAIVIGLGGALGSWLGGRVSDGLRRHDVRWSLWLVALIFVVARPFAMAFYGVSDATLALVLFVLPAAVGAVHIGPSVAVLHDRIAPQLRPLASALFQMILTLVGLGLGPLAVGVMSETVFSPFGADSLRWSLAVWQLVGLWAAVHFYFAGRALASD